VPCTIGADSVPLLLYLYRYRYVRSSLNRSVSILRDGGTNHVQLYAKLAQASEQSSNRNCASHLLLQLEINPMRACHTIRFRPYNTLM